MLDTMHSHIRWAPSIQVHLLGGNNDFRRHAMSRSINIHSHVFPAHNSSGDSCKNSEHCFLLSPIPFFSPPPKLMSIFAIFIQSTFIRFHTIVLSVVLLIFRLPHAIVIMHAWFPSRSIYVCAARIPKRQNERKKSSNKISGKRRQYNNDSERQYRKIPCLRSAG